MIHLHLYKLFSRMFVARLLIVSAFILGGIGYDFRAFAQQPPPTQTVFTDQQPVLTDATDNRSYELGMKFSADVNGEIAGIRYFKATSETGTHTGRIWSANGTLLASVNFTNETASGWQEATLATPLGITANSVYTVSVNTNSHYVFTLSGLATSIVNGNLSTVADNNNGVFGDIGAFPTSSFFSSNYWRDVRFRPTITPPPTQTVFTDQQPVLTDATDNRSYELGMKFTANVNGEIAAIRYFKATSETGAHTGRIWSANGTLLASVNFTNETASGWQEATLATPLGITANSVYTVSVNTNSHYVFTLSGLATSIVNGNLSTVADNNNGVFGDIGAFPTTTFFNSNYWRDVRFRPTITPPPTQTVFTDQQPVLTDATDNRSYELGMKFTADVNGEIAAIRYFKATSETGTHTGRIWSTDGLLLASVEFTNETASGWQEATLATPLAITANSVYTVSVNTNSHYVFTLSGLATSIVNGNLSTVADNNNGVFGDLGTFPTSSFFSSNYWRDVRFRPTSSVPAP